ncbi:cell division protein ZipA [Celerinatantimonas yamalensis]|uniref:Cell division protein ZipA n=1 Tax=Celerinatantimonas yamalensis TaxID=559956 RepID=A0ABW9GAR1_9GAMM
MQELRIVLIIIGIIAIAGLLAHGFLSNRRNRPERLVEERPKRKRKKAQTHSAAPSKVVDDVSDVSSEASAFDDLGVGEVHVVGEEPRLEPQFSFDETSDELADDVDEPLDDAVMSDNASKVEAAAVHEPKADAHQPKAEPSAPAAQPDDVYVLNVVAATGEQFEGSRLLACLTSLGLKFGEMNIYHRHLQANGHGAIIFSVANMVKPGTFDPEHMEHFSTQGVSLFMTVPCAGEPSRNFNVMYNAAERIVLDMDGILLDGHRNPFTAQTLQHYQQRIREYERQQLLQPNSHE